MNTNTTTTSLVKITLINYVKDVIDSSTALLETTIDSDSNLNLSSVLLSSIKYGSEQLLGATNNNNFSDDDAYKKIARLQTLMLCVVEIKSIIKSLKLKQENYFSTFEPSICYNQVHLIKMFLEKFLNDDDTKTNTTITNNCHISSHAFWYYNFCKDSVSWRVFENAFTASFPPLPSALHHYHLSKFKECICDNTSDIVSFTAIERHCKDGIYKSFQRIVNPCNSAIHVIGSITDNDTEDNNSIPKIIPSLLGVNVASVSCGGQHVAITTKEGGNVYTFGRGKYGRLGHGDIISRETPTLVQALVGKNIISITCGFAYTFAVTSANNVYSWGAGENGRIGTGDKHDRLEPTLLTTASLNDRLPPIQKVYAGSVHTVFHTLSESLYTCGKHEYTGHQSFDNDILLPTLLQDFHNVKDVSVGPGGYHTIAVTFDGKIYTWGNNRVGQLGINPPTNTSSTTTTTTSSTNIQSPSHVPFHTTDIRTVVAGWGTSAIITTDGQLWQCGRNTSGQLGITSSTSTAFKVNSRGHEYNPKFTKVSHFENNVLTVACGGEFTMVLVGENKDETSLYKIEDGKAQIKCHNVTNVVCGTNCTVVQSSYNVPSKKTLVTRALDVIRDTPELYDAIVNTGLSAGVPAGIIEMVQEQNQNEDDGIV